MDLTKPSSSYLVDTKWSLVSGATSYKVSLSDVTTGTSVASAKVTATSWSISKALKPGDTVKVTVTALAGKRPGRASSVMKKVPDLTAPTGTYTLTQNVRDVTVNQTALQDDLSSAANIKREINWDEGTTGFQAWASGTTAQHSYPAGKHAYHPAVRLTDEAGNHVELPLTAVAIDDTEYPAGSFNAGQTRAWAKLTPVTLTQVGVLSDDVSAAANIKRAVDWKDGTAKAAWTAGATVKHVYAVAGSFAPTVTLTDESGKSTVKTLPTVVVRADTIAPRANLVKPRLRRTAIRSWVTLHGRGTDVNGTGVRYVRVRVIESRAGVWFAYRATTRNWVKAGTKARALRVSRPAVVHPRYGKWAYRLPGLRKGTLIVKVWGSDMVGNVSTPLTYRQLLTRR